MIDAYIIMTSPYRGQNQEALFGDMTKWWSVDTGGLSRFHFTVLIVREIINLGKVKKK